MIFEIDQCDHRRMSTIFKILYLAVHVALSALMTLLIWAGFEMSNYRDGSSTTSGGLLAGLLTLLAWGIMAAPLIAAVATKWVSCWWLVTHWLWAAPPWS
ncbi:hypothetical protein F8568_044415 [Actinomadura sp. LD22]|uniref:Uncharacterized protein n=1 Tax=Actinomadura physcomitrii TaxID=2650748 RepID=A0A6I4MQG8_9ACTN|nr:hypothetical protein [Actinomadura physcomitrii]MWA07260.1 hypothetical protein [Actinomadura physcomitrii]